MIAAAADSRWAEEMDAWCALPAPDRRPIYAWIHDQIESLPECYAIRGRFQIENSPWLREPFHSMQDPLCRRTTCSKAIQSAGTLLAELTTIWRLANDPGNCTFTMHNDKKAEEEAKTRMNPLLESCTATARLLPRKGPMRTTQEIYFGGFFFILNAANEGDQQSQSVRYKINDEVWMDKWAKVYMDACGRVTAFEQQGTSHILDVSQGGFEDEAENSCDWATWSFNQGTQEIWSVLCANPSCGRAQHLAINDSRRDGTRDSFGFVFEGRRDDGTYDEDRAGETARWVCPHCGHNHADSDATRLHWRTTGHYLPTRPGLNVAQSIDIATAPLRAREWRSFRWDALTAHPMRLIALEYARAENHFFRFGDDSLRQKFRQKRQARPWRVERTKIEVSAAGSGYRLADVAGGAALPGELMRTGSLDKQDTHWWLEIGAWVPWSGGIEYRQLWFSRVETIDAAQVLLKRYGVLPHLVAEDRRYKSDEVDRDCVGFGWTGLAGSTTHRKRWTVKDEASGQMVNYPYSPTFLSPVDSGRDAPYIVFDGDYFKDLLSTALAKKTGLRWLVAEDVNPLWLEHIRGESKQEVRPGVWEWHEVKTNAPNHGLDTSVMQLVIAMARGVVRFEEVKS